MFKTTGVLALIRRSHEEQVLRSLREQGSMTRGEISSHIGLSRTTLSEITKVLLARGAIVVAETTVPDGRGRPAERLAIDPAAGQFLGVDFGRGRVHIVVADASHEIIASGVSSYEAGSSWSDRIAIAFTLIDQLSISKSIHYGALQGVGVGYPGPLPLDLSNPDGGIPVRATGRKIPDATGGSLVRSSFVDRFGTAVAIDNNSRFAALAEALWGNESGTANLVYVRLSDGIGGGLVIDGQLVTGAGGFAGELGHISVNPNGLQCHCGKRGCLETIASIPSILAGCQVRGVAISSLDELRLAVAKPDPIVESVLREAGDALGRVLGTVAVTLNPSQIVIGGDLVKIAPVILHQAVATISYELLPVPENVPLIRAATLGDNAGALGAIAAILHQSTSLERHPAMTPGKLEIPESTRKNQSAPIEKKVVT